MNECGCNDGVPELLYKASVKASKGKPDAGLRDTSSTSQIEIDKTPG